MSLKKVSPFQWTSGELNQDFCLNLNQILVSFNAPISEVWAYAIIYESCKALHNAIYSGKTNLSVVATPSDLYIHQSGFVHPSSFEAKRGAARAVLTSECKAVSEMGLVIYSALDFEVGQNEERKLPIELENILEMMVISADTEDEGIDADPRGWSGQCQRIMEECRKTLSVPSEAESHFAAVCRAMISETLELATFMQKVTQCDEETAKELQELDMQDWARLWVSCLKDLRQGIKLKKVNYTKTPVEYELTPYEMLMDDIRSKRYTLNKIMIDGEIPVKVKQNAHDVILEFIRSRPPLKPATERQLNPLTIESTPVELLMASIRNSSARSSLRKTTGPVIRSSIQQSVEHSRTTLMPNDEEKDPNSSSRKLILPRESEVENLLDFSQDFDDETESVFSRQTSIDSTSVADMTDFVEDRRDSVGNDLKRVARDLALHGSTSSSPLRIHSRRHSVTVCETPPLKLQSKIGEASAVQKKIQLKSDSSTASTSSSGSATPTSGRATPTPTSRSAYTINTPQMHANLQSELLRSTRVDKNLEPQSWKKKPGKVSNFKNIESKVDTGLKVTSRKLCRKNQAPPNNVSATGLAKKRPIPKPRVLYKSESELTPILEEDKTDTAEHLAPGLGTFSGSEKEEIGENLEQLLWLMMPRKVGGKNRLKRQDFEQVQHVDRSTWSDEHWTKALKTLDLNLEEVVHIRSVLTKAELEALPLEGELKEDVEKGKICFLCMKTRFGFFTWGVRCQLCRQQVCGKCSEKMRIPIEHFSSIPSSLLTNRPIDQGRELNPRSPNTAQPHANFILNSAGSAPNSPKVTKRKFDLKAEESVSPCNSGPVSLPVSLKGQKKVSKEEQIQGSMLQICADCKEMVLQVIRAQRTAKRFQFTKTLYNPNYQNFTKEEVF